ncbi:MAG: RING finger domain-containing protein [Promethearchaeota archaeon]
MKCLICHKSILDMKYKVDCPNNHSVHLECLEEWLSHSKNCPLCSTPYPKSTLDEFQHYFDQKEQSRQEELEKQLKEKERAETVKIAEKIKFKKFLETIQKLEGEERYVDALDKLNAITGRLEEEHKYELMFLKGKMNYLRKRYDMTINFLFKLVKEKFDYPDAFLYLGRAYEELGLSDKAKWAFERVPKE